MHVGCCSNRFEIYDYDSTLEVCFRTHHQNTVIWSSLFCLQLELKSTIKKYTLTWYFLFLEIIVSNLRCIYLNVFFEHIVYTCTHKRPFCKKKKMCTVILQDTDSQSFGGVLQKFKKPNQQEGWIEKTGVFQQQYFPGSLRRSRQVRVNDGDVGYQT